MNWFDGVYFDGLSSKSHRAKLAISNWGRVCVEAEGGELLYEGELDGVKVGEPLGTSKRPVCMSGGGRFFADDNGAAETVDELVGGIKPLTFVDKLEKKWRFVLLSLAGMALFVWAGAVWGIPVLAETIAMSLPRTVVEAISEQAEEALGEMESELDHEKRSEIQRIFDEVVATSETTFDYRLTFVGPLLRIPNAFALPSGRILITDEMVALEPDPDALAGIFAHEIAHVERRHGLRRVLQSTGVAMLVAAVLGDVGSVSSLGATIPTILMESGYSREFEREADRYAVRYLIEQGRPTEPLAEFLKKLSGPDDEPSGPFGGWFATHPGGAERFEAIMRTDDD